MRIHAPPESRTSVEAMASSKTENSRRWVCAWLQAFAVDLLAGPTKHCRADTRQAHSSLIGPRITRSAWVLACSLFCCL